MLNKNQKIWKFLKNLNKYKNFEQSPAEIHWTSESYQNQWFYSKN